jgi:hypothetical protein
MSALCCCDKVYGANLRVHLPATQLTVDVAVSLHIAGNQRLCFSRLFATVAAAAGGLSRPPRTSPAVCSTRKLW